jgi:hypothetical protein
MFLEYFALGILIVAILMVIYVFIYIHDIPHRIAKQRGHPQAEAIHVACWLSLFTLHALWPIVFMWAVSKRQALAVEITKEDSTASDGKAKGQLATVRTKLTKLEERIGVLERRFAKERS